MRLLVCLLSFCLSFCTKGGSEIFSAHSSKVKVIFEDDDAFLMDQKIYEVEKGSDLTVFLDFQEGYSFKDINYAAHQVEVDDNLDATLTLYQIRYPLRLKVQSEEFGVLLSYHLNGGKFLTGEKQDHFNVIDSLRHHARPNVSIGTDRIYKNGYLQVGWNTQADGSGTHVGLGSRITASKGRLDLYAEWVKTSDSSYFQFEENDTGGITITSYMGPLHGETLCIPSKIGDNKVTQLGKNLFWNISYDWVILPPTLYKIDSLCFSDFRISKLTFFDNLQEVEDSSFDNLSVPQLDIQALMAPRFISDNDNARFTENIDNLILAKGKKKMVFFAGCSMSYGLKSEVVKKSFPSFEIINCGVIGGICATMQLDIIGHFLEKGDVFIHAPEEMSSYQLLHEYDFAMKCFMIMESNYDLFHYTDLSFNTKIFSAFRDYNVLRNKLVSQSYDQYNSHYNDYGDICFDRPNAPFDSFFDLEECFSLSSLDDKSANNFRKYFSYLEKKGVIPFFSYASLNLNALKKVPGSFQAKVQYESFFQANLNQKNVISKLDDYLLTGNYFYDTDYHLSDDGALLRSERLIGDIQKGLNDYA